MELTTAEALDTAEVLNTALKLKVEHFGLPCLATLGSTNKCWRARVQAALGAAAPTAAQQLLLQTAGDERSRLPPVAVFKPLLKRASSTADGAAGGSFMTALATNLVSHPDITWSAAGDWLLSGLQLTDAAICAAARIPSSQPALWVKKHKEMLQTISGVPLSPILQALCDGLRADVSLAGY
jgi:hypothetical protein